MSQQAPEQIVLIGFMGSGKTTIGRALAKRLNYAWRDLDQCILESTGATSVSEIFAALGEQGFREKEAECYLAEIARSQVVISTGGGVVTNQYAQEALRAASKNAVMIFLKASFKELCRRVGAKTDRPLFKDLVAAERLFHDRQAAYADLAQVTIEVDELKVEQVMMAIEQAILK